MRLFSDRKTVWLGSVILFLIATNLLTLGIYLRSPKRPTSVVSSTNYLPPQISCQPLNNPANPETLEFVCTLANPNQTDLQHTVLSLKDFDNASFVEANLPPTQSKDHLVQWDLGVLPALQQFTVFVKLRRTNMSQAGAWLTSQSDGAPQVATPLILTLASN